MFLTTHIIRYRHIWPFEHARVKLGQPAPFYKKSISGSEKSGDQPRVPFYSGAVSSVSTATSNSPAPGLSGFRPPSPGSTDPGTSKGFQQNAFRDPYVLPNFPHPKARIELITAVIHHHPTLSLASLDPPLPSRPAPKDLCCRKSPCLLQDNLKAQLRLFLSWTTTLTHPSCSPSALGNDTSRHKARWMPRLMTSGRGCLTYPLVI